MTGDPLVSIQCLVYNHEPFLRQCLDGFVMQQTTFPFEAIVHDDASTDGSAAIIREYAEKYPDIIKPVYETENQWGKGTIKKNMDAVMSPKSKYIAICEGDDYWTDPHKLQLQVSFLEEHPDYSLSVHDFKVYEDVNQKFRNSHPISFLKKDKELYTLTLDDYKKGVFFTQTLTCVYRLSSLRESCYYSYPAKFDMTLFYALFTQGKCMLFNRDMGVYRIHSNSITSGDRRRRFHNYMDSRLLNFCAVEKTNESKEFVYNYLKPLSLSQLLCKRWNVIFNYFKYLGICRGIKLTIIHPCRIALGILFQKIRGL